MTKNKLSSLKIADSITELALESEDFIKNLIQRFYFKISPQVGALDEKFYEQCDEDYEAWDDAVDLLQIAITQQISKYFDSYLDYLDYLDEIAKENWKHRGDKERMEQIASSKS